MTKFEEYFLLFVNLLSRAKTGNLTKMSGNQERHCFLQFGKVLILSSPKRHVREREKERVRDRERKREREREGERERGRKIKLSNEKKKKKPLAGFWYHDILFLN